MQYLLLPVKKMLWQPSELMVKLMKLMNGILKQLMIHFYQMHGFASVTWKFLEE